MLCVVIFERFRWLCNPLFLINWRASRSKRFTSPALKTEVGWQLSHFKIVKRCLKALVKSLLNSRDQLNERQSIFSINIQKNQISMCMAAHIHKDYPATRLTPGQTCSISVLTTVFTGSWLPNQYCRLRYTTPQLGHSITYLNRRRTGHLSGKSHAAGSTETTESREIPAAVLTLTRHTWQGPAKGNLWKQRFLAPR